MKINHDIMSTYILLSNFMKINQDIISTYILIYNFMKLNQDIIVTYWTLTGFPYIPFVSLVKSLKYGSFFINYGNQILPKITSMRK